MCTEQGEPLARPPAAGTPGYPANGDANYAGLCSFACNFGFCPPDVCSTSPQTPYIPDNSPFSPPACTAGTGSGALAGLCSFGCSFGFCPIHACQCTDNGYLVVPPAPTTGRGFSLVGDDSGLCQFACSRDYCPPGTCSPYTWPVQSTPFNDGECKYDFVALGDSYAAGIGASSWLDDDRDPDLKCKKTVGAYPWVLYTLLGTFPRGEPRIPFYFAACSGAVIQDITHASSQGIPSQLNNAPVYDFWGATLSIGGNDAGFGEIAESCLFWQDAKRCQQLLAAAPAKIAALKGPLMQVYYDILDSRLARNPEFLLIVTGYGVFFDASNDKCTGTEWFGPWGQYLTSGLRCEIDYLVALMNIVITDAVNQVNADTDSIGKKQVAFYDIDLAYQNHRFCDPANEQWKDDAWYFRIFGPDMDTDGTVVSGNAIGNPRDAQPIDLGSYAGTCQQMQFAPEEWDLDLICDVAVLLRDEGSLWPSDEGDDFSGSIYGWQISKALHPKTIAHNAIANGLANFLSSLPKSYPGGF